MARTFNYVICRNVEFAREKLDAGLCDELAPLMRQHYKEVAHYLDIELSPRFDEYIKLDEMGFLRCFTARERSTKVLTGYCVFFVRHNMHYSTSLQAVQDVLYIDPDKRGFGAKFIVWCDEQLSSEGVQVVYHHIKHKADLNFGHLLMRMGYEFIDEIYGRRLDK